MNAEHARTYAMVLHLRKMGAVPGKIYLVAPDDIEENDLPPPDDIEEDDLPPPED